VEVRAERHGGGEGVKKTTLLVLALVLGSVSLGLAKDTGPEVRGLDELAEQKGRFEVTLIRPDTDLGTYTRLYPHEVRLRPQRQSGAAPAAPGSLIGKRADSRPDFSRDDVAQLEGFLRDALVRELGRSESIQLVEESGPATLILRTAVVDVASRKAPRSARRSGHGERLLTAGTLFFDLIDSRSGVLLARIGERRKIKRVDQPEQSYGTTGPWPEVGPWAEQAARDLLQELEDASAGSS